MDAPRIATIHEYLDWTVTAEDALGDNELVRSTAPAVCTLSSVPYHLLGVLLSCGQSSLHSLSQLCKQTPPCSCGSWAMVVVHSLWAYGSL